MILYKKILLRNSVGGIVFEYGIARSIVDRFKDLGEAARFRFADVKF